MQEIVIKVENLCKSYGEIKAVNDISFDVKKGELFAFLGLNGAGKSTTINIISGSLQQDSGRIFVENEDTDTKKIAIKNKIGIVFQNSVLDKNLTVKDNLILRGGLYDMSKEQLKEQFDKLVALFELKDLLRRKVKTLSGGQRRRADIARALIHNPQILIMDEPTTGLDPQTRNLLWEVVAKLRQSGLTVFLTTHYMEETSNVDRVVIIDDGIIAVEGTPLWLKQNYSKDIFNIYAENVTELKEYFAKQGYNVSKIQDGISIDITKTDDAKDIIAKHGHKITDFEVIKGDMNSVFLNITGKSLRG